MIKCFQKRQKSQESQKSKFSKKMFKNISSKKIVSKKLVVLIYAKKYKSCVTKYKKAVLKKLMLKIQRIGVK